MENKSAAYSEKKFRMSPFAIICYAIAGLTVIYMFYLAGSTVSQINEYYAQFEAKARATDYIIYIARNLASPAITGFTFFMLGYILDTVRKLDPANYVSQEDIDNAKMARQEAKDAKAFAKGEKAAAKAEEKAADKAASEKSNTDSVAEDFANSLDKELKAASKPASKRSTQRKPAAKKTGEGTRKKTQNKSGSASANKGGQRKTGSAAKKTPKKESSKPQNEAPKPDEGFKVEINE